MSSKALIYYRKAELCLRRGDLKGAVLQLKMAIASDPQSTFLRSALAEVEDEGKAKRRTPRGHAMAFPPSHLGRQL